MSIFGANIPLLITFLKYFASCLSKKQMALLTLVIYALFKDYKRNSLDAMARATHTDYQKFQYSSQIQNGISRQSSAQDWKSFKNKEPLLP
ncbi:MAG: hypothetical protein AYP45_10970, partial [Candidatus Brocadia carolinensis]